MNLSLLLPATAIQSRSVVSSSFRLFLLAMLLPFLLLIHPASFGQSPSRVGGYTYAGPGTVNTWWIETKDSLIVIDVQRDLPHARQALHKVQAIGKPVRAILITHGHPDHFAGLEVFRQAFPRSDIYASQTTYETIKNDPNGYMPFMKKIPGNETFEHANVPLPNRIFADNQTLSLAGVDIETKELGIGETNGGTAYYLPATRELFTGDVVLNNMQAFFLEEHSAQ